MTTKNNASRKPTIIGFSLLFAFLAIFAAVSWGFGSDDDSSPVAQAGSVEETVAAAPAEVAVSLVDLAIERRRSRPRAATC